MEDEGRERPCRGKIVPGIVNRDNEHMELLYGDPNEVEFGDFTPVALVAPGPGEDFTIEFTFLPDKLDEQALNILGAVRDDLDFYLLEKGERDPWNYAKYHCSTSANMYSKVHWSYHDKDSSRKSTSPHPTKSTKNTRSRSPKARKNTKP